MKQAIDYAKEVIEKYPSLKEEINDLLELCADEIEAGESHENEVQLCINSIDDLIEEYLT